MLTFQSSAPRDEKANTLIPTPVSTYMRSSASARRLALRTVVAASLAWSLYFLNARMRIPVPNIRLDTAQIEDSEQVIGKLSGEKAEDLFLTVPNPASALAAHRLFASTPHMAGTPQDLTTAKDFLRILQRELGIAAPSSIPIFDAGSPQSREATLSIPELKKPVAWIDKYFPVMNQPLDRALEILDENGKPVWQANVEEVADDLDPEAGRHAESIPAFHGLSRGGDVQGQLIYANYGRKEDYDALVKDGVNLTGKIVITRYGGIFRGLKVKGAQELGAIGCLIYNDPRDDGTVTPANGYATYPQGPARNPTSLQRGSVQFLSIYPGDPTTPGYPAYENATRTDGINIPAIPSLPISWANAQVLLREIGLGDGDGNNRTIRLLNNVDEKVIPIWNTMGVIPGRITDEVVVIGNHRDAWVMGATDPSSGTASVHEVIRGFGTLLRSGWKPLRTIVIASWDAEEYGLIGSTEWGEDFAEFIDKHVVAYLNVDSSVSGSRFRASASPSLAHLVRATAQKIPHPTDPNRTLWDARSDSGPLHGEHVDAEVMKMFEEEIQAVDDIGVSPLGSGSDYTVFLQRIGVASSNGGFGPTLSDPVYHYHSVYDSVRWQEVYTDPGFFKHIAISKHLGLQALRLADSVILPLNITHYAFELGVYVRRVEEILGATDIVVDLTFLKRSIANLQAITVAFDRIKERAERRLNDALDRSSHHFRMDHAVERTFCHLMRPFQNVAMCSKCASKGKGEKKRDAIEEAMRRVREVNAVLVAFERSLIDEDGIHGREWYRHLGVAPGLWKGYGATTLPALTEAIVYEKNATLAATEALRVKRLIDDFVDRIQPDEDF